jgi:uncharacterized protein
MDKLPPGPKTTLLAQEEVTLSNGRPADRKARMAAIIISGILVSLLYYWIARGLLLEYPVKAAIRLILFMSLPLLYNRVWQKLSWRQIWCQLMPKRRQLRRLLLTLLIGSASIALINLLAEPVCRLLGVADDLQNMIAQTSLSQGFLQIVLLYVPLVNALGEEMFFRFGLYLGLADLGSERGATLFSAGLFSLYHLSIIKTWFSWPILLAMLAGLFIAGLFLNHIARRDKHILGIWLIHGLVNSLVISLSMHYIA